jgi:hypothetical protein
MNDQKVAKALGWASIAIGLSEICAPGFLQKPMGVSDHDTLLRSMGAREIAEGVAILRSPPDSSGLTAGVWSRVAGDALDLALLGAAATKTRRPSGLAATIAMVAGITLVDVLYAFKLQKRQPASVGEFGRELSRQVPGLGRLAGAIR